MSRDPTNFRSELPRAKTRPRHWAVSVIWTVPIIALLVAAYLVFDRTREYGTSITLRFRDADGLKAGQTPLNYRGVEIGVVNDVELSPDSEFALVRVKLRRFANSIARDGSLFWIVRPQLGMGSITGLGTIITGPHIEVQPGTGKPTQAFVGIENSPVMPEPRGTKILLVASHAGSIRAGIPVFYRGVEVGVVEKTALSTNAAMVDIHATIRQRYAALVQSGSKFWNVTGLDVRFGLFRGAEINVESLKSLVIGGIAFATPEDPRSIPVRSGAVFRLYDEPQKDWQDWSPTIRLPPEIEISAAPGAGGQGL